MDLLASFCRLVSAAAMGKAIEIWVACCCIADTPNVCVSRASRIWSFRCHGCALMGVVGEGAQGVLVANERGGGEVSLVVVTIGSRG